MLRSHATALLLLLALPALPCAGCYREQVTIGHTDPATDAGLFDAPDLTLGDAGAGDAAAADTPPDAQPADTPVDTGVKHPKPCAEPVIDQIKPGLQVVPQTTVDLCGDHSKASAAGKIIAWSWTLQQPEDAHLIIIPGASSPCIQVRPEVIGLYRLCLEVKDVDLQPGCKKTCVELEVYPPDGVHIELTWQTADPPAANVTAGADFDLHFAHMKAKGQGIQADCAGAPYPWFDTQYDAFGLQSPLNWGVADPTVADDPILVDNVDGSAPERLDLAAPEGSAEAAVYYTVGVHYWNDHGHGPATARLRVFIDGSPVAALPLLMQPLDMWTVGRVVWPNAYVGGSFPAWQLCLQQGDPCAGHAPWQKPPGGFCLNQCFKPKGWGAGNPPAKVDCP